jgi:hypothetical protein
MWLYFGASSKEARLIELSLQAEGHRIQVAVPQSVGAAFDMLRAWRRGVGLLVAYVCSDGDRLAAVREFLMCQQAVNAFPVVALCSGGRSLEIAREMGFRQCMDRGFTVDELRAAVRRLLEIADSKPQDLPADARSGAPPEHNSTRCMGSSRDGTRCGRLAVPGKRCCWQHRTELTASASVHRH